MKCVGWASPALLLLLLHCGTVDLLCTMSRQMHYIEREECKYCVAINTTICSGYCITRDLNVKTLVPKSLLSQNICTYSTIVYKKLKVPGCPPDVDPYYHFAVITGCKCSQCNTDTTDCVNEAEGAAYCSKPQWRIPVSNSRIPLIK
ncbi:thyrotropin subunit beta-like [Protopterus annectens]|uniref:thyrotropin subunit beta-like n=1 Tax=Protopterus annectens TaxID=7888 RepID=UPI001CFA2BF1|nr:thyrotropin subunit beta-like [Protopterus annectens]XP_043943710.1 thyrotropin subunit beta-like [Protopterus annectens]